MQQSDQACRLIALHNVFYYSLSNFLVSVQNPWVRVFTYNTDLKNRLTKFAAAYPELCRQTDDDDFGGLTFMVDKKRFSIRLTAPYTEERKQAARELAKKRGLGGTYEKDSEM